jgi:hypothetical protein
LRSKSSDAVPISIQGSTHLGYAYGRSGRRVDAEKIVASVAPNAFSQAIVYAGLRDKDRTLEALDRAAG